MQDWRAHKLLWPSDIYSDWSMAVIPTSWWKCFATRPNAETKKPS